MKYSRGRVKGAFSHAATTYDAAAVLQKEILARLLDRLKVLNPEAVNRVLDVGSGTGLACNTLVDRYGEDSYFACDFALPMLQHASQYHSQVQQHAVCADVEALAYQNDVFDIVFSASTYQWCNDLANAFQQSFYSLKQDGLFIFSTFGPGTLHELRSCFAQVDQQPHVSSFMDIQTLGDNLHASGFRAAVVETETICVEYSSPMQLLRDLQATGATNHLTQRTRQLTGKSRLKKMLAEYEKLALTNGKFPASYEVIYAHGWKADQDDNNQRAEQSWQPIRFR